MWPMPLSVPKPKDYKRPLEGTAWVRERKHDGHCVLACRADGEPYAVSPSISDVTGVHELHRWKPPFELPPWTALHGELWWPDHPATDVANALAEDHSVLRYTAWHLVYWDKQDCRDWSWWHMRRALEGVYEDLVEYSTGPARPERDLQLARERRYEGWVYKWRHGSWGEHWYRLKVRDTVDLAVIGVKRGEAGQYQDQVGALVLGHRVGQEWVEVCRCSGMTQETRAELSERLREYVDKCTYGQATVEYRPLLPDAVLVEYDEVTRKGSLKFPRFKGLRTDKGAEECHL